MRNSIIQVLAAAAVVCSSGCVTSLHPLSTTDTIILPDIEGTWILYDSMARKKRDDIRLTLKRSAGKTFDIDYTDERGTHWKSTGTFVRLGNEIFLEFMSNVKFDSTPTTLIPTYGLYRARYTDGKLQLFTMPLYNLRHAARNAKPPLPTVDYANGWGTLITASTAELQDFFREHGDEVFSSIPDIELVWEDEQ